jgi:chemotaxis signal transduction protein
MRDAVACEGGSALNQTCLVFSAAGRSFALPVEAVERIVAAAETTAVDPPRRGLRGLVNVAGEVAPVVDVARCLGQLEGEMELTDRFVLVRPGGRLTALWVEAVDGVCDLDVADLPLPVGGGSVTVALDGDRLLSFCALEGLLADLCSGGRGERG